MPDAQLASSSAPTLDYSAPRGFWIGEHVAWLRTLRIGAAITAISFVTSGTWSFAVLCMRVRGFPSTAQIQGIWPFESLGVMVLTWAGVWLLTTPQPWADAGAGRLARVLRTIVTVQCLLLAMQRLGLLEEIEMFRLWSDPVQYSSDVLVMVLLGVHLCLLCWRSGLSGLMWRLAIALPLRAGVVLATLLVPRTIVAVTRSRYELSWEFWNFRSGLLVLTSALCALTLLRLAFAMRRKAAVG